MASKVIRLEDYPNYLEKVQVPELRKAVVRGIHSAAIRLVGLIQTSIIPSLHPTPVDRGVWRAGWKYEQLEDGSEIYNDEPHAPFIDFGVRAENVKPGKKMIDALAAWVERKGLVSKGESARSIAFAIANRMKKRGIFNQGAGFRVIQQVENRADGILKQEISRELSKVA